MVLRRAVYGALIASVWAGCDSPCAKNPGCVISEGLPGGLLSVRAPAPDNVWLIGSSPEPDDDSGPALWHFDGGSWTREDTTAWAGTELWWGWIGDGEQVFVGSDGLILEREEGTLTAVEGIDPEAQFFGVWGASADQLWAVGNTGADGGSPVLYERAAGAWSQVDAANLPAFEPADSYFKVEGAAANDVWVVGSSGLAMHYDGSGWTQTPTDTDLSTDTVPLLTVTTRGERPVAVGGFGNAVVLEYDGTDWRDASPVFLPGLNGVCAGADTAVTVGQRGARAVRIDGEWTADELFLTDLDWHGCAVDSDGGVWSVGGRIASRPLMDGVLAYQGPNRVPELPWE